jgi:hypothetical protein
MKLESKKKCTMLDGTGMLIVNVILVLLTAKKFAHERMRDFIASTKLPGSPPTCIMENYALPNFACMAFNAKRFILIFRYHC